MNALFATEQVVISNTFVPFNKTTPEEERKVGVIGFYIEQWKEGGNQYLDDPVSDLYFPIFDIKNGAKQLVAMFKCFIYWRNYLEDILPQGNGPLLCVLENTCGDVYSYEISGPHVGFLGEGDLHDPKFDNMVQQVDFSSFQVANGIPLSEQETIPGNCIYSLRVYPSDAMENKYLKWSFGVHHCTSMIFVAYDWMVRHQQRKLLSKAIQSGAIVSTLFPKVVRDRLYAEQQQQNAAAKTKRQSNSLGAYIDENPDEIGFEDIENTRPIAERYENCTVLFIDLVGFTKWSSGRQPSDVFWLLESIYGAFDKLAKKNGVFKVETIGDCVSIQMFFFCTTIGPLSHSGFVLHSMSPLLDCLTLKRIMP